MYPLIAEFYPDLEDEVKGTDVSAVFGKFSESGVTTDRYFYTEDVIEPGWYDEFDKAAFIIGFYEIDGFTIYAAVAAAIYYFVVLLF